MDREDAIYLVSHCVRIWHKAVLCREPRTNRDSCVAGTKFLDTVGIPFLGYLSYQAINLVLQAGKDLDSEPLMPRYQSMRTKPNARRPGRNGTEGTRASKDRLINYHHHKGVPIIRIPLTISRYPSLSVVAPGKFSSQYPLFALS